MLKDTGVIATTGEGRSTISVLGQCYDVTWRNGSAAVLHELHAPAPHQRTRRALRLPERMLLIDLERVLPGIDADLCRAHEHDVPGLIHFSLRHAYAGAAEFVEAAERTAIGTWHAVAGGYVWGDTPRALQADWLIDFAREPQQVAA